MGYAERAHHAAPGDPDGVRLWIWCLADAGFTRDALSHARKLVKQDPSTSNLILLVDMAASAKDISRRSLSMAKRLLASDPTNVAAHHAMGRLRLAREETRRARTEFETVLRLDPRHATARYNLAAVRSRSLDIFGAAADFADLAATSDDRERSADAAVRVITRGVYVWSLVPIFSASLAQWTLAGPSAPPTIEWALAGVALLLPAIVAVTTWLRLGSRGRPIIAAVWRRRPTTLIAAGVASLTAPFWIAAALDQVDPQHWYKVAMLPGVTAALTCFITIRMPRRR